MKASEILRQTGRAIAYRPKLAKLFGGATAEIFFEQIFYWQDKTDCELGVYKTQAEIEDETGLTRREQETARKRLRELGLLIETHKRLEHRIYFKIDMDRLDELLMSLGSVQNVHSPMAENAIRETTNPPFVNTLDYNTRLHTKDYIPLPLNGESANADESAVENDKENISPAKNQNRIDYQAVVSAYNSVNEAFGSVLPKVIAMNDKRRRGIKKFLSELKAPTVENARLYFEYFFADLKPFHKGDNKNQWVASFDYAIRSDTVLKVKEGNL